MHIPVFPGAVRKNDALFMYGAREPATTIYAYEQNCIEIVCGPSCRMDREILLDQCKQDAVSVVERRSGGGTVVLSPGMVIAVISGPRDKKELPLDIFHRIHTAIIHIFELHGIDGIEESGISDLSIGGRKIAGSSIYLGNNPLRYYYQSSIMVCSDLELIDRYLQHPPREPLYRQARSHGLFCTTLVNEGYKVSTPEVCAWLSEAFVALMGAETWVC